MVGLVFLLPASYVKVVPTHEENILLWEKGPSHSVPLWSEAPTHLWADGVLRTTITQERTCQGLRPTLASSADLAYAKHRKSSGCRRRSQVHHTNIIWYQVVIFIPNSLLLVVWHLVSYGARSIRYTRGVTRYIHIYLVPNTRYLRLVSGTTKVQYRVPSIFCGVISAIWCQCIIPYPYNSHQVVLSIRYQAPHSLFDFDRVRRTTKVVYQVSTAFFFDFT